MRSAISALAGFALVGSFAFAVAQPSDGRLKIIHETAMLRVAYRTDSRPFSYVDAQGRPIGYTIELCERIARCRTSRHRKKERSRPSLRGDRLIEKGAMTGE
jgi:glutamate/aspartate transport system substrate-binding protein